MSTAADIRRALREYDVRDIIAVLANNLAGGNGGSEPGAVRLLDLGIIDAAALAASGPVTLYTPADGEIVFGMFMRDYVYTDSGLLVVYTSEVYHQPIRIGLDVSVTHDGLGNSINDDGPTSPAGDDTDLAITTMQPLIAGVTDGDGDQPADAWQANTAYDVLTFGGNTAFACVIGSDGHLWVTPTSGTSGDSEPDFAGNEGGSVVDNDITWLDSGQTVPTIGSAHVFAYAATPVAP